LHFVGGHLLLFAYLAREEHTFLGITRIPFVRGVFIFEESHGNAGR
jgi:hypothetical protein